MRMDSPSSVCNSRLEVALFVYVAPAIEKRLARAANVLKREFPVIDTVAVHLLSHVMDRYARAWGAGLVADSDKECVNAFVCAVEDELSEHYGVVGVHSRLEE